VEFIDINHCITTKDDFVFVSKEFVKPTKLVNRIRKDSKIEASQSKEDRLPQHQKPP